MARKKTKKISQLRAEDDPAKFNMAHMGLRLGQRANGVSMLHGLVSREMFNQLWPGFDPREVPIGSMTNGVHAPSWAAPQWLDLGGKRSGPELARAEARVWERLQLHAGEMWSIRSQFRRGTGRGGPPPGARSWIERGASSAELGWTDGFRPDVFTVGFARRVPTYKRLTLMLRDHERLQKLLLDEKRPIQLIVAGEAHPADDGGKALIQQVVKFADRPRSGTASPSCPTTTCRWHGSCTGAATCG